MLSDVYFHVTVFLRFNCVTRDPVNSDTKYILIHVGIDRFHCILILLSSFLPDHRREDFGSHQVDDGVGCSDTKLPQHRQRYLQGHQICVETCTVIVGIRVIKDSQAPYPWLVVKGD